MVHAYTSVKCWIGEKNCESCYTFTGGPVHEIQCLTHGVSFRRRSADHVILPTHNEHFILKVT